MQARLASSIQTDSIVDGEGIRAVIWMQGCSHNCPCCHNPSTHDFKGGFLVDIEDIKKDLDNLSGIDGITLSGGDPMFQIDASLEIAKYAKKLGLNVWCYTGYTFEQLLTIMKKNKKLIKLLENIDVLIDGRFEIDKLSYDVAFRGSKNQRILDVSSSLKMNEPVEIEKYKLKDVNKTSRSDDMIFI